MPSLGDAYVDVRADTKGFARDLDRGVTSSTQAATTKMGGLTSAVKGVGVAAAAFIGAAAVGAVVSFGKEAIQAASDLGESINAVNVSFGNNADEILDLGEAAAQNLGLSNAEFNALAVSVGAFTDKIAAGLGQEVPEVMDTLTTRIADFASVMNLDVDAAFEKFRSGLAGESEPLRQFGIDVSAATVEQVALAEGIIETGEEMTEAEKVTARYLTIMEQTEKVAGDFANTSGDLANAQRIANAEMENAKARAGEALVPFAQLTAEAKLLGAELLGIVATGFDVLFGDLTKAQGALQSFELLTGASADTLEALVTVNRDTGISLTELSDAMNLTVESSVPLTESQRDFLTQIGFTSDELQELDGILREEHDVALREQYQSLLNNEGRLIANADATGDLAAETDEATSALQNFEDEVLSQTDPLFGLLDQTQNVAEAQAEVAAALDEFSANSPEYEQALIDLAKEEFELEAAQLAVAEQSDLTASEFATMLQTMTGLSQVEIDNIISQFERINAFRFDPKTVKVNQSTGFLVPKNSQLGGFLGAGEISRVGEAGPELFVPSVPGHIIPNHQLGGFSANIVVNMTGGSRGDAVIIANEIERRLERLANSRVVR